MSQTKCIVCLQKSAEIPPEYLRLSNQLLIKFSNVLSTKINGFESRRGTSFPFCCQCRVDLAKFAKLNDKLESVAGKLCQLEDDQTVKLRKISFLRKNILENHNDCQDRFPDSKDDGQKGDGNVEAGLAPSEFLQPNNSGATGVEIVGNAQTSELIEVVGIIQVVDGDTDVTSNPNGFQPNDQPPSDNVDMDDKMESSLQKTGTSKNLDACEGRWVSKTVEQVSEKDFIYQGKYPFERTDYGFKCGTCPATTKLCEAKGSNLWDNAIDHMKIWHLDSDRVRKTKLQQKLIEIAPDRFQYGNYLVEKQDNKYRCVTCGYLAAVSKGKHKFKLICFHINHKHENPGKNMCELCGMLFSTSYTLKLHKITLHDPSNSSYPCSSCEKTFKTQIQAHRHENQVHSERYSNFICEICGQKFQCRTNLEGHVAFFHNGEKIFKCNECGKAYGSSSSLAVHQNSHTGQRKYACELCGMQFSQAYSIKRHKMTAHKN